MDLLLLDGLYDEKEAVLDQDELLTESFRETAQLLLVSGGSTAGLS